MNSHDSVTGNCSELLCLHRNDQQAAIGKPSQSRRFIVDHLCLGSKVALEVGRDHSVAVHIAEPQPLVLPARTFPEPKAIKNDPICDIPHGLIVMSPLAERASKHAQRQCGTVVMTEIGRF